MERPTEYYSPDDPAVAPQLSAADLKRMSPEQITAADDLGQFAILRSGRDPLPCERSGERLARPDEVAAATRAAKAQENKARQDRLIEAKKEGIL